MSSRHGHNNRTGSHRVGVERYSTSVDPIERRCKCLEPIQSGVRREPHGFQLNISLTLTITPTPHCWVDTEPSSCLPPAMILWCRRHPDHNDGDHTVRVTFIAATIWRDDGGKPTTRTTASGGTVGGTLELADGSSQTDRLLHAILSRSRTLHGLSSTADALTKLVGGNARSHAIFSTGICRM